MEVRSIQPSEARAVYEFLAGNGWSHRIGSLSQFTALLAASQQVIVAVAPGGRVVGFARAITDGLSNGYLSMVIVAPEFRRQGIGRALVAQATAGAPSVTWVLRAGRGGSWEFFARPGFRASTVAMERSRE
jgi:ribosomal protein S18 acetylase RimI-like enzyme